MDKAKSRLRVMAEKTRVGLMVGCAAAQPLLPCSHSLNIH